MSKPSAVDAVDKAKDEVMRKWRATKIPASLPVLLGILAAVAVGVIAWKLLEPPPSKQIRLAAGRPGGAYYKYAEILRGRMARHGFDVQVIETAGGIENQRLLASGEADLGFLQGGAESVYPDPEGRVRALASIYYEPLWVFRRSVENPPEKLADLAKMPVAIGEPGSGTHAVSMRLFELNGLAGSENLLEIGGETAIQAFVEGRVHAVFLIMSPNSETLRKLLETPGVELMSFRRHRAYARNLHFIRDVSLPEGILDLRLNLPKKETTVLTTVAQLAANKDLHPGIVQILLREGVDVFGKRGLLEDSGEFPTDRYLALPLHRGAEDWFIGGPSFLSRYLPFDAVIAIKRLGLVLLPILTILLPLFKIAPMIYRWQMRRRIFRWYVDLIEIEQMIAGDTDVEVLIRDLRHLEADVCKVVEVPPGYRRDFFLLRMHIDYVRKQLAESAK